MKANEKKCPQCAEAINQDAKVCRHCGYQYSDAELAEAKAKRKKEKLAGGIGCLALILITGTCVAVIGGEEDDSSGPAPAVASAVTKTEIVKLYRDVLQASNPCDGAYTAVAESLQRIGKGGTVVDAYARADEAEHICLTASGNMQRLKVPKGLPATPGKTLKEAMDSCEGMVTMRWASLGTMKKALDGDDRPSVINDYYKEADAGEARTIACVTGLMQGADQAGVKLEELNPKAK